MANNKTTITSIPLQAQLNMNRNQTVISTSYDQLNRQNSPIYGGCISPLHTKGFFTNDYKSLVDKFGKRWFFRNNILYRRDEDNGSEEAYASFNGSHVFKEKVIKTNASSGCLESASSYFLTTINDNTVRLVKANGIVLDSFTPSDGVIKNARICARGGYLILVVIVETSRIDTPLTIYVRTFNRITQTFLYETSKAFSLGQVVEDNRVYSYSANSRFTTSSRPAPSTYTYPIIISAIFAGIKQYVGITVLNRHMNGESVCDDFGYCNFLYCNTHNYFSRVKLSTAPFQPGAYGQNRGNMYAYIKGGKTISYDSLQSSSSLETIGGSLELAGSNSDQNWATMRCAAGIWSEDSKWVYQVNYGLNRNDGFYKGNMDYLNVYSMSWYYDSMDYAEWYAGAVAPGGPQTILRDSFPSDDALLAPTYREGGPMSGDKCAAFWADDDCDGQQELGEQRGCQVQTLTTNQYHLRFIVSGKGCTAKWGYGSSAIEGNSTMLDSMLPTQSLSMPGILSTTPIPTDASGWENLGKNRWTSKTSMYNTSGSCTNIGYWRVLFNYKEGFLSGISYTNGNTENEGTLVTPWDEVDDGFVVCFSNKLVMYKDVRGYLHIVTAAEASDTSLIANTEIVDNRYLIVHCDAGCNVFDLVEEKWGKFASDWNNRILEGYANCFHKGGIGADNRWIRNGSDSGTLQSYFNSSATYASGFNVAYQSTRAFSPSRLLPFVTANYCVTNSPYAVGMNRTINSLKGAVDKSTLDYFQSSGTASPKWKGSIGTNGFDGDSASLQGTAYPITNVGSLYNNIPIIGTNFINSYNGKFALQINNKGYSMLYDGVRPICLYNVSSVADNVKSFFIVQSQTYAVVDSYICAISYSGNNVINGIQQLVDVNGMEFIGSFPTVAYFYSPSSRSIYAFTGDADLQLFVQTDRISTIYSHLYSPNNEWIYILTNDGMYVLTQLNAFRVSYDSLGIVNPETAIPFMTDDKWNVIEYNSSGSNWNAIKLALDRVDSSWSTVPVEVETEFFGPGDGRQDVVDTWYVRLFKADEDDNKTVTTYVSTMTEIVKKGVVKEEVITPDKWDDNNNYQIRVQPDYQMCQGSSFYIKSYYPIAWLAFSHQTSGTTMSLSPNNAQVGTSRI